MKAIKIGEHELHDRRIRLVLQLHGANQVTFIVEICRLDSLGTDSWHPVFTQDVQLNTVKVDCGLEVLLLHFARSLETNKAVEIGPVLREKL